VKRRSAHDRNAVSILRRQEKIGEWIARIKEEGSDNTLYLDNLVLVGHSDIWGAGHRLGMIVYNGQEIIEYHFNREGLQGTRKVSMGMHEDGSIIFKYDSLISLLDSSIPDDLPEAIDDLIPHVSGYQAGFGGMFPYDSDVNPLID